MESKSKFGVILAGGRASRMGYEDKGLKLLGHKAIVQWVADAATLQTESLLLSINHNPQHYAFLGLEPVKDEQDAYGGPLVGIVSTMRYLRQKGATENDLLACFPADVPWFPDDLAVKLIAKLRSTGSEVVMAEQGDQLQPLFSVWSLSVLPVLDKAISSGLYGPKLVLPQLRYATVRFPSQQGHFYNINTPEDLRTANQWLPDSE